MACLKRRRDFPPVSSPYEAEMNRLAQAEISRVLTTLCTVSLGLLALVFILLFFCSSAQAQSFSFSDLFGQSKKQLNYYEQQIAAYNAFESELKQGYNVIQHGLSGIAAINTAELNAHSAYYASLKQPSPAVKNNTQVQDMLNWQAQIVTNFSQSFSGLTGDEQTYVASVKTNLLNGCNADMTDLQNLLASGTLQMSDDQRLKRLDKLHSDMQDKYLFSCQFCNSVKLLAVSRTQNVNDTQTLTNLYESN